MITNIKVNWDNYKSILKAERLKSKCENIGFNLTETKQIGFNKYILVMVLK